MLRALNRFLGETMDRGGLIRKLIRKKIFVRIFPAESRFSKADLGYLWFGYQQESYEHLFPYQSNAIQT